jgi:hypothetical protein
VVGTITALVAFGVACRLHMLYLRDPGPVGFDDGYTMALGERLIDGHWLPYVDGCSHRGPMLYWAAAIAQALTGRFGWLGTRWLIIVTTMGTLLGLFATGLAARRPFAGGIAVLFCTWSTMVAIDGAFKVTGEGVASPFAVAAMFFTAMALYRSKRSNARHVFAACAGTAAALAGLAKQTALPTIGPLALWIAAAAWSQAEWSGRDRWRMLGALAGGFALPLLVVLVRYAASGELHTFWYWYARYNAEIYMSPFKDVPFSRELNSLLMREPWAIGALAIVSGWGIAAPLSGMKRGNLGVARGYAAAGFEATSAWLAMLMFAAAVAPMRNWPHYFLCVYPFVGLLVGAQGETLLRGQGAPRFQVAAHVVAASALIAYFAQMSAVRLVALEQAHPLGAPSAITPEPLCKVIDEQSGPRDAVFIWGFDGDIYLTCRRRPASRFTYLTLVAGTVPPAWTEVREDRVAHGARQQLIADLRQERPPVILDMPQNMGNISMRAIPVLAAFLDQEYCPRSHVTSKNGRSAGLWVRRDLPPCGGQKSGQ